MTEKVNTQIILNCEKLETRFALLRNERLEEYQIERVDNLPRPGSIYLGKIINLEPSLQAAFVDIGAGKNAFLHYWDILETADQEIVEVVREKTTPQAPVTKRKKGKATELHNRASKKGKKLTMEDIPVLYKPGTEILVQVVKSPMGSKGARVTTNLSIAGRSDYRLKLTMLRSVLGCVRFLTR